MAAIIIDHHHSLDADDARDRLKALGSYLGKRHGINVTWTGQNKATVHGSYLIVKIDGWVELRDSVVHFEGKDPGMLWRKKAKSYLESKLTKYFNAATPISSLPGATSSR